MWSRVEPAADDYVLPLPLDTVSPPLSLTVWMVQVVVPLSGVWVPSARGRPLSSRAGGAAVAPLGFTTPTIQYVSPAHAGRSFRARHPRAEAPPLHLMKLT